MANDETNDVTPPAIVLDEHDAAAVMALLIRTVRLDDELRRDKEMVAEANARIAVNTVARSKTVTAFGVFGFDTGEGLWARVIQSLGEEPYGRAIAIGKGEEIPKLLEKMGSDEANADVDRKVAHPAHNDDSTVHRAPRIKDAILGYLQDVGDAGATARAVGQHLSDVHNLVIHEKTPGMTLYRLLKEGRVRRNGKIWYADASAETHENEAPDGRPKGASEIALDGA